MTKETQEMIDIFSAMDHQTQEDIIGALLQYVDSDPTFEFHPKNKEILKHLLRKM